MLYLLSVAISFTYIFLKGLQHQSVIDNRKVSAFWTSYAVTAFEVLAISIVIKGGWIIAVTSGAGAACGMLSAMLLHDRIYKHEQ